MSTGRKVRNSWGTGFSTKCTALLLRGTSTSSSVSRLSLSTDSVGLQTEMVRGSFPGSRGPADTPNPRAGCSEQAHSPPAASQHRCFGGAASSLGPLTSCRSQRNPNCRRHFLLGRKGKDDVSHMLLSKKKKKPPPGLGGQAHSWPSALWPGQAGVQAIPVEKVNVQEAAAAGLVAARSQFLDCGVESGFISASLELRTIRLL